MSQRVVIVGAGLAGASAALRLAKLRLAATVLEARERVGGRAFLKPFAGHGPALEYGGAWITPWQHRIRKLVEAHGLTLRPRHPVSRRQWLRGGEVTDSGPTSQANRSAHERAIARVAADAMLLKKGHHEDEKGRPLTGISFSQYLSRLDPPQATRNVFSAWWSVSGNGDPDVVAASEFLASCAYGEGLAESMIDVWADTVVPGMARLIERMLAAAGADLRLGHAVVRVSQTADEVTVVTADGKSFVCDHCILALGVNQLAAIEFSPALSRSKRRIVRQGHGGRAFKLWIKAVGVPLGTLVTGDGRGLEFAFAERADEDGATLIVGFGITGQGADPGSSGWVRHEVARLFPNARFVACDWHDWVADPFARGTWVAAPAGLEATLEPGNWLPEGRLYFASSDIAREQAGWFEAAVVSGEDAADAVLRSIAGSLSAAGSG